MTAKTDAQNMKRANKALTKKLELDYNNRMKSNVEEMKRDRELGFTAGSKGLPMPKGKDKWFEIFRGYQAGCAIQRATIFDPSTPPN